MHLDQASPDSAAGETVRHSSPSPAWWGRLGRVLAAAFLFAALADPAWAALPPPTSFADLAAKVKPAVVTILSTHQAARESQFPFVFPKGSPFEDLFRRFQEQQGGAQPVRALGSGFVIDPAGYIVTNNHVVDGAKEIQVTLSTGTRFPAKLVGVDPKSDLALLKIDAPDPLPSLTFGDSDAVRVGDWVMAVGNPFGFGGTVTAGIVSARGRDLNGGSLVDYLQIDAAINRGNSGGPTVSTTGEVIGINTAIVSPNGGSVGIGFAIPSNEAKPVIDALREHGSVERGWLGVKIQGVTDDIAQAIGLDKPAGALVSDIQPDGPAARSDLHRGDVILAFNGQSIEHPRDLQRLVAEAPIGKQATLTVWHERGKQPVTVTIEKLGNENVASNENENSSSPGRWAKDLGVKLARITPDLRDQFDLSSDVKGVVVVDVDPNGPAAEQGIQPGDVIEQIAQKQVTTPSEAESIAEASRADHRQTVLLLVNRQGEDMFVAVKVA